MLYDDFKPIVDLVLNNWTALQLAVEHGMGAPGGKQVIIFFYFDDFIFSLISYWSLLCFPVKTKRSFTVPVYRSYS